VLLAEKYFSSLSPAAASAYLTTEWQLAGCDFIP